MMNGSAIHRPCSIAICSLHAANGYAANNVLVGSCEDGTSHAAWAYLIHEDVNIEGPTVRDLERV
jgi:hypothetical protein